MVLVANKRYDRFRPHHTALQQLLDTDIWHLTLTLAHDWVGSYQFLVLEDADLLQSSALRPNFSAAQADPRGRAALVRLLRPSSGAVLLDGELITSYPAREVARRLGLLPQAPITPDGITVFDLVSRGRYPHWWPTAASLAGHGAGSGVRVAALG